jgi:hypothetical protein
MRVELPPLPVTVAELAGLVGELRRAVPPGPEGAGVAVDLDVLLGRLEDAARRLAPPSVAEAWRSWGPSRTKA